MNQVLKCFNIVAEPANKAVSVRLPRTLWMIHNGLYKSGKSSLLLLSEPVRAVLVGLSFKPFSHLYELVNEKQGQLTNGGLIDYWGYDVMITGGKSVNVEIGPQVLTMDHLAVGFQVCLILLMFSFALFILEIGSKILIKFKRIG